MRMRKTSKGKLETKAVAMPNAIGDVLYNQARLIEALGAFAVASPDLAADAEKARELARQDMAELLKTYIEAHS